MQRAHVIDSQDDVGAVPNRRGFDALLAAYGATGGTACGDALGQHLQDQQRGDLMTLARLITNRQIFTFEWQSTFWIPMFQFEPSDFSARRGPSKVLAELSPVFEGWALAAWFAQPNCWLHGKRPVDQLDVNLPAVFAAARADRFVAAG